MKLRLLITLCSALLLSSCQTTQPLYKAQVDQINANSSESELNQIIASSKPELSFEQSRNNTNYFIRLYQLVIGADTQIIPVCTPTTGCMQIPVTVPVTTQYAIIQKLPSSTLFAWGSLEELSKDSNEEISSLMPGIKDTIQKLSEKSKK